MKHLISYSKLNESSHLFESAGLPSPAEYDLLLNSAVHSIFKKGKSAMVLGWEADDLTDRVANELWDYGDDGGGGEFEHNATVEILYLDPNLVEILKRIGRSARCEFSIDLRSEFDYSERNENIELSDVSHEIVRITLDGFLDPIPDDYDFSSVEQSILESILSYDDVDAFLRRNHKSFKNLLTFTR